MRRQIQHKRFTISMRNDLLSLAGSYWHVQPDQCPCGMPGINVNENEKKYTRPCCVQT